MTAIATAYAEALPRAITLALAADVGGNAWDDWTQLQRVARVAQMEAWLVQRGLDTGCVVMGIPHDGTPGKLKDYSPNAWVEADWSGGVGTLEAAPPEDPLILHCGDTGLWQAPKSVWGSKSVVAPYNDGGSGTDDLIVRYAYITRTVLSTATVVVCKMDPQNYDIDLHDRNGTRRLRPKARFQGSFNIWAEQEFDTATTPADGDIVYGAYHRRWTGAVPPPGIPANRWLFRYFYAQNGVILEARGNHQFYGSTPTQGSDSDGYFSGWSNTNVDATSSGSLLNIGESEADAKMLFVQLLAVTPTDPGGLAQEQAIYDALRDATD